METFEETTQTKLPETRSSVSSFYHENDDHKVLRFCFAKKEETLSKAIKILSRI